MSGPAIPRRALLEFIDRACKYQGSDCLLPPFDTGPLNENNTLLRNDKFKFMLVTVYTRVHGLGKTVHQHIAHNCGNDWCLNPHHLYLEWNSVKAHALYRRQITKEQAKARIRAAKKESLII